MGQQNAGEGPGLLRGLLGVPGSGRLNFLSELLGFKSLAPQLPVKNQWDTEKGILQIVSPGAILLLCEN
jgi:hypothetical protein